MIRCSPRCGSDSSRPLALLTHAIHAHAADRAVTYRRAPPPRDSIVVSRARVCAELKLPEFGFPGGRPLSMWTRGPGAFNAAREAERDVLYGYEAKNRCRAGG